MDQSLFKFIWKHSARNQIVLLIVTLATFPILYVSLELPKRIINDAIGGSGDNVTFGDLTLSQTQFLMVLCFGFLLSVLVNGLLKMRLNTMKGVLSERLLRRFRYAMLNRVTRFPRPYFRKTSQGELVSMITAEAEPMGGLMGDLLSQPVFQAGQMATILVFLFAQSFWFGLASVALIPLQAWLIPKLQRQINMLNKQRIQEVRRFASEIGETAAGVSDIRTNGGLRYRMSMFSNQLNRLFHIRFMIFQKKFFMKFLNNFINQLTPFFFYSVGGYLAIRGEITVGALVAALAAYKDLSDPWKELLTFYNTTQDMAVRWETVIEKFAPKSLVDDELLEGEAEEIPRLNGDIVLTDVTVVDEDGNSVLEDLNLTIPGGSRVGIKVDNETAALAVADVLTREVTPRRGRITIGGYELNALHQDVLASRIGYAHSKPYIFQGSLGENLLMPFKREPLLAGEVSQEIQLWREEALRSGNSPDPFDAEWVDPQRAGFDSREEIHEWWFELVQAMGIDDFMVRRALSSRHDPEEERELCDAIVRLRPEIARRLSQAGLDDVIHRFDPDKFNPVSPLGSNLLYAMPTRLITQVTLAKEEGFLEILREEGIIEELAEMSANLIEGLVATFGNDGVDHPLFRRLNLDEELYFQLGDIAAKRREVGDAGLPPEEFALLLTVPFAFSAEQMGPAFDEALKERVLEIRKTKAHRMVEELGGMFEPIDPEKYIPVMTLMGNAIFGRISSTAGAREKEIEDILVDILSENDLRRVAAQSIFLVETAQGGENLPAVFRERIAFSRAGIKKPDILILGNALASHPDEQRAEMRERVSQLMPDTTKIFIEQRIARPESYDLYVEIVNGRIAGDTVTGEAEPEDTTARNDLNKKLRILEQTDLFGDLDRKQLRLLAFGAQWYEAKAGKQIFKAGDPPDGAYLCVNGLGALYWPTGDGRSLRVTDIPPGRLIGDLAVIQNQERVMNFFAEEDSTFLRIGASELLAVVEHDPQIAMSLLRTVASHLSGAANRARELRQYAISQGIDFSGFDDYRQPPAP
ncbi:ABC transporter transmembrane domain-containing protein [Ovoidimarina sediminis]|uniref:ABC transporter transmembrane domain-containing protein n=1 Tax=Ovoidimarina sediminis TaxID=3079856 RepID=UPI002911BA32|nr:ABC transporter transmembrane domain-containing protein [Rhodophyticola sp. MJ-SS7]MDU8944705.1 ABC transporter transmembrane domain-containing protein [Rhodophyticola sp. MJ-SS7]